MSGQKVEVNIPPVSRVFEDVHDGLEASRTALVLFPTNSEVLWNNVRRSECPDTIQICLCGLTSDDMGVHMEYRRQRAALS